MKLMRIKPLHIVYIFIVLFSTYFVFLSFARHDNFYSRRLDLGNMDQTVWNVLHGNGFTLTDPMGDRQESRLAVHADFLLILLAPFYLIWSNPKMLLLIQVIVTALGAIPVYWIARDVLKSEKLGMLFAVAYLFYPPLERKMLSDFHAVALSTTFLLYAYWYMVKKKDVLFVLFLLLAALGKEQIWLTTALMGLFVAFVQKRYAFGSIIAAVSIGIFYYLFWHAIPAVTPAKQHFALVYLSEYGDTQNRILLNMIRNPSNVLRTFFFTDRLYYYFQIFSPFGFLPFLSPLTLIFAMPSLVINILSNNSLMRQIDYQYNSTVTPFIVISAVYGYSVLQSFLKMGKNRMNVLVKKHAGLFLLICAGFLSVYTWGELPVGKSSWFWFFITPLKEKVLMKEIESAIDPTKSVSVTNNIGSHFSQREFVYNYPINAQQADYTVIYLDDPYAWPSGEEQRRVLTLLQNDARYEQIAGQGLFYAFKKK